VGRSRTRRNTTRFTFADVSKSHAIVPQTTGATDRAANEPKSDTQVSVRVAAKVAEHLPAAGQ